jgi:hypothetical protein
VAELTHSRREFLARAGILGAAAVVTQTPAAKAQLGLLDAVPLGIARQAMQLLARDTASGLVVFAVPGGDAYSRAQGHTSGTPGAIDARAQDLLLDGLDNFLPLPDTLVSSLAGALATGVSEARVPADLLAPILALLRPGADALDRALQVVLRNDGTVPLSALIALLLNFEATAVSPTSVVGPFLASPFANLRHDRKAEVFRRLEQTDSDLVALLDGATPEPLKDSVSGLVKFAAGILLEFAAFGPYTEYGAFDRASGEARSRPVGWELSRYLPGRRTPVDGHPELRGYLDGRRAVETAPEIKAKCGT